MTRAFASSALLMAVLSTPASLNIQNNNQNIVLHRSIANAAALPSPSLSENQRFVSDVWFAVAAQFFDPTYNGLGENGWRHEKEEALTAIAAMEEECKTTKKSCNEKQQQIATTKVIDVMLSKLGDPYTRFLPPDKYRSLVSYASGGRASSSIIDGGIGVQLLLTNNGQSRDGKGGGDVMVMSMVPGGPAASGGVMIGDVILEVDGVSTVDDTAEFVASKTRGEVGSQVKLLLQRVAGDTASTTKKTKLVRLNLVRENVVKQQKSVESSVFESDYSGSKIGLLQVNSFTPNTATDIASGVQEIKATSLSTRVNDDNGDISAIVIDLRGNVGGYMPAGIDAARRFLPARAAVAAEIDSSGSGTFYFGDPNSVTTADTTTPLYVLVDDRTASAAEIFTAALKDNRRAIIVGPSKTFGKGRIQNIQSLEGGSGIAVTRARFITPGGKDIHGIGIQPTKIGYVPTRCFGCCLP